MFTYLVCTTNPIDAIANKKRHMHGVENRSATSIYTYNPTTRLIHLHLSVFLPLIIVIMFPFLVFHFKFDGILEYLFVKYRNFLNYFIF